MQGIEAGPDEQIEGEERGELIEGSSEAFGRQTPQAEQRKSAPQIPEQSGAQSAWIGRARDQLRNLRSRAISFSCAAARTSSARACA